MPSYTNSQLIQACQQRREKLLAQLPANSVAIIPAATEQTRSNDTEYLFRQNSDFFYLTGFDEPDAVLVLLPGDAEPVHLFVRAKDELAEIWHGRRLGAAAAPAALGVNKAYEIDTLETQLPQLLDKRSQVHLCLGMHPQFETQLHNAMNFLRARPKQGHVAPNQLVDLRGVLHEMRLIKDDYEILQMSAAAEITAQGHKRAMHRARAGMLEFQLEAEILHEFAQHGARHAAYNSIVASGDNGCILHYTENDDYLESGEMVLIDAGCEYLGYAGDVTRTFPVDGAFTPAQQQLYQLVLDAQLAAFEHIKPGGLLTEATAAAIKVLTYGLVELGILQGEPEALIKAEAYKPFFMHGIGHYLGLDVHDVGTYKQNDAPRPLEAGMVITIEPGLYIAPTADVPEQWRGMAVRIEDNLLITADGFENLTASAPKTIAEIEECMASGSVLAGAMY